MSVLSICKECNGWRWTPGPEWEDALIKLKIKEIQDLHMRLKAEGKTVEQYLIENGYDSNKKYEFAPLREGECGCGR